MEALAVHRQRTQDEEEAQEAEVAAWEHEEEHEVAEVRPSQCVRRRALLPAEVAPRSLLCRRSSRS